MCVCVCQVAEGSPYYEAFKRAGVEVLFCYQEHDEIVLGNLGKYKDKTLKSIEVPFSLSRFSSISSLPSPRSAESLSHSPLAPKLLPPPPRCLEVLLTWAVCAKWGMATKVCLPSVMGLLSRCITRCITGGLPSVRGS